MKPIRSIDTWATIRTRISGLPAADINVFSDSQIVVNQVNRNYQAKETKMITYLDIFCKLESWF